MLLVAFAVGDLFSVQNIGTLFLTFANFVTLIIVCSNW